jgi:hypothetical protein
MLRWARLGQDQSMGTQAKKINPGMPDTGHESHKSTPLNQAAKMGQRKLTALFMQQRCTMERRQAKKIPPEKGPGGLRNR